MPLKSCYHVGTGARLTDVFGAYGHRPAQLCDELLGVQSDLDDIVEQSEEGGEWERGHKQRHKAELDDWQRNKGHKPLRLDQRNVDLIGEGSFPPGPNTHLWWPLVGSEHTQWVQHHFRSGGMLRAGAPPSGRLPRGCLLRLNTP